MFWTSILFFLLLKKIGFVPWPVIMLSQTFIIVKKFSFWLWCQTEKPSFNDTIAKSNNVMRGQFECDVTWFCFSFDFVCSRVWCCCCSTVCSIGGEGRLKIERPNSRGWKKCGPRWTGRMGLLKFKQFSWASYVYHPL